jgi:hypothetical protein
MLGLGGVIFFSVRGAIEVSALMIP